MKSAAILRIAIFDSLPSGEWKDVFLHILIQNNFTEFCMKEKLKRKLKTWAIFGVLILVTYVGVSKTVSVSNTVNGKELPIYSVETEEKKVALSFDAAWGDGRMRY